MRRLTSILILIMAAAAIAAPPEIEIGPEVRPSGQYARVLPKTDATSIVYVGLSGVDPMPSDLLKDGRMFLLDVRGLQVGRYKFAAVGTLKDEQARVDFEVVVGNPPVVVVPPPGPGPVNPQEPVSPVAGMRVLTIWESDTPLPKDYNDSLTSKEVVDYLAQKCLKGPDGKTPERRTFDEDVSLSQLPKPWQDLRAALPQTLPLSADGTYQVPHVAIGDSSGAVVFKGPHPKPAADALTFFKKYGGN